MTAPRPDPILIADHPALDFLNSICAPQGELIDWLTTDTDLGQWLEAAGLRQPNAPLPAGAAITARRMRDWFRALIETWSATKTLDPDQVTPLNLALKSVPQLTQVTPDGQLCVTPAGAPSAAWTSPLVRAMADLISQTEPARVRQCEGPTCTLWFHDTSPSNRRRWCSMAVCGNRAKVAAFRARKKD